MPPGMPPPGMPPPPEGYAAGYGGSEPQQQQQQQQPRKLGQGAVISGKSTVVPLPKAHEDKTGAATGQLRLGCSGTIAPIWLAGVCVEG